MTNPLPPSLCCVYPVRLQIQCLYSLIHDSTFCNRSHLHLQLPLRHNPSRAQEHQTPDKQAHASKDLATLETPVILSDQRTTDWIPRQRTQRGKCEQDPDAQPNLADITDLCDERRGEADEGTGRDTIKDGEDDCGRVSVRRQPYTQDEQGCEEDEKDVDVEAADFVADVGRYETADYAAGVDNGDEVEAELFGHAVVNAEGWEEVHWQEHAEEEEEG